MNSISSISLHVTAGNEGFIQEWYRDFELFAEKHITAVADRVLARCDQNGFEIEISKLDIDLGSITEEDFETTFEQLLEEKLEESLLRELLYPTRKEDKRLDEADYQLEALKQFLLSGNLNWNLARRFKNITELFQKVLKNRSKELSSFLRSYGHYTSLQQRLIYQFEDESLFDAVKLIAPEEFSFIRSYVLFLRVKYAEVPKVQIREEERRIVIWKVIYAYLLSNQSAAFNKKLFVKGTIGNLAAHINLSYSELLRTLTRFSDRSAGNVVPSGLEIILHELKQEEYHSSMSLRAQKPHEWAHILREMKTSKQEFKLLEQDLDQLRSLLENEKGVLRIIKPMREPEIFDLVRLIVSASDASFVSAYSQHLNKQNQSGALQGKSSGEFLLFKWQIIFPLIVLSKNSAINREYLVWQVFKRLSARYNTDIRQIIAFAYREVSSWNSQPRLQQLVTQLYQEYVQGKVKSEQSKTFDAVSFQISLLEEQAKLTRDQLVDLKAQFNSSVFRELLLNRLGETARHRLLSILLPAKASELSAFMHVLDRPGRNSKIAGRAIASIQRLKWTFLFDVLEEIKNQVFNHEHIVQRILEKTGAHYNLSLKQLVDYFFLDFSNSHFSLPFNLYKILASIKTKIDAENPLEKSAEKLLLSKKQAENKKLLLHYFVENEQSMPLINAISQEQEWMNFLVPILDAVKRLVDFIQRKWKIRINNQLLLQNVFNFSKNGTHRSQKELLHALWQLVRQRLSSKQEAQLIREFLLANEQELLFRQLKQSLVKDPDTYPGEHPEEEEEEIPEDPEKAEENSAAVQFIDNAGLVLISPFLPRLFTMLELTENGKFRSREAQIKAIFLMQYAAAGNGEFPEYALQLNKLLVQFKTGIPIPRKSVLTDEDKNIVDGMLEGVLQNWGRLTNTTAAGLREGFLCREGRLEEQEDTHLLTVEAKAFDMLLDQVPWNFRTIKFSWMKKAIQVKWR